MTDALMTALVTGGSSVLVTAIATVPAIVSSKRSTTAQLAELSQKLDKHIAADEAANATNCRSRILQRATDVRRGGEYPKEDWDSVLQDITTYEKYTATHPDYPNEVCEHAINFLCDRYDDLLETDGFLKI